MGGDGGSIPRREELVRTRKPPEQKDKTADLAARWKYCAISQDPLRAPIVACELGRLYNKESVLELLIDRSKFECASSFEHLRGLKDVKELVLTEKRNYTHGKSEKGDGYIDSADARYICPIVGIEMNGMYKSMGKEFHNFWVAFENDLSPNLDLTSETTKLLDEIDLKFLLGWYCSSRSERFSFLWPCGCVLSDRALKEVKGSNCHKCGKPFSQEDVISINGTEEDVERLRERMKEKRLRQKLEKKAKKSKKHQLDTPSSDSTDCGPSTSKQHKVDQSADMGLTNDSKRSKVKTDSKSKLTNGSSGKSLAGSSDTTKKTGSIQNDPNASSTFKSLFTTSSKAKNQMKNNWVTFNPYWN